MTLLKLFLRIGIGCGMLSAVGDRFGFWPGDVSAWGNWQSFLDYTHVLNPWIPGMLIPYLGILATVAEALFGLCVLIGLKTEFFAKLSGVLLLLFGVAMAFSLSVKAPLDYSVFAASGAAFALSTMKTKFLELDLLFFNDSQNNKLNEVI